MKQPAGDTHLHEGSFRRLVGELEDVAQGRTPTITIAEGEEGYEGLARLIANLIETNKQAVSRLELRNRMLAAVNNALCSLHLFKKPQDLLESVCRAFLEHENFCLVWVGDRDKEGGGIVPLTAAARHSAEDKDCIAMVEQIAFEFDPVENPVARVIETRSPIVFQDIQGSDAPPSFKHKSKEAGFTSCASLPLVWEDNFYGALNIYSNDPGSLSSAETDFLENIASDISLAVFSLYASKRFEQERDLNQEIIEAVDALLISVRPCGTIRTFNTQAERLTGYDRNEVIGKHWVDVLVPERDRKGFQQVFSSFLKDGGLHAQTFQSTILCKSGEEKVINWRSTILSDPTAGELGLIFIGIDITEHLNADKALDRVKAEWEEIFTAIQDPAMLVSPDGIILAANPATLASSLRSREEIVGKGVCEVLHGGRPAGVSCPLEELLRTRRGQILETTLQGLRGEYLLAVSPVRDPEGDVKRILLVARNLSEEKIRKAEALRAGHLAAIGELAAGVAHEINNPINGIINYSQFLLDAMGETGDEADILRRIIKEGERIAGIVRNLLSFARGREDQEESVGVPEVLEDSLSLVMHQLLKNGIQVNVDIPADIPMIRGNHQQIQQVFLNLLSNARYALNQRFPGADPGKRIDIVCRTIKGNDSAFVRTAVTDYGVGMPQDILDRIIEPFFSTKPSGEGTGLGLSISHGIVKDHHGFMKFESVLGDHTTVVIDLPVCT